VVHWTEQSPEIPSWQQAQQHMSEKGKLSKVNHPSAAQAAQQIPAPQPSRVAQTLKPARQIRT